MRRMTILLGCLIIFFLIPKFAFAADFQADYSVGYFVERHDDTFNTRVRYIVTIKNLVSKNFVQKFTLAFPRSFEVNDIRASDDHGPITPEVTTDQVKTLIELPFSNPATGKDSTNHFYLDFYQPTVFTSLGGTYDLSIPTIQNKQDSNYKVIVTLPSGLPLLSSANPQPSTSSGSQLIWDNVKEDFIHARLGKIAKYKVTATYDISNPTLFRKSANVLYIPDTAAQTLYVTAVNPLPQDIRINSEGDYVGLYDLLPYQKKKVTFEAYVEVSDVPITSENKKTYGIALPDPRYGFVPSTLVIKSVQTIPQEKPDISLSFEGFSPYIHDKKTYVDFIKIKNEGHTFVRDIPVEISAEKVTLSSRQVRIVLIAPYQTLKIPVRIKANPTQKVEISAFKISVGNRRLTLPFSILAFTEFVGVFVGLALLMPLIIIMLLYLYIKRRVFKR